MTIKKFHVVTISMILQSSKDGDIAGYGSWDRLRPLSPFLSSIYLGLGSPTVLYLLTQLKKQSVDRLRSALFFADAATKERKGIVLRKRGTEGGRAG